MLRSTILLAPLLLGASPLPQVAPGISLIEGRTDGPAQPDGNSVVINAPDGLIVVDTGRHRDHQDKIVAFAEARGRDVVALVNTHWHLDHSGGNAELRARWPDAPLYASRAVDGALAGALAEIRKDAEGFLAAGRADAATAAEIRGDLAAMDDRANLVPNKPIGKTIRMKIAGRIFDVNLADHAVTAGDLWLHDRATGMVIAGDLVVAHVPYFDTACAEGWRRALDRIAELKFTTLIPGHGAPMTRPQFLTWRGAFNALLDCATSDAPEQACIDGWTRDAKDFLPADTRPVEAALRYYLKSNLRAEPAVRNRYCAAGTG